MLLPPASGRPAPLPLLRSSEPSPPYFSPEALRSGLRRPVPRPWNSSYPAARQSTKPCCRLVRALQENDGIQPPRAHWMRGPVPRLPGPAPPAGMASCARPATWAAVRSRPSQRLAYPPVEVRLRPSCLRPPSAQIHPSSRSGPRGPC
ncbi:hypothetical protein ZWY2020_057544 [Hordeum vulgare]|nr:hypothetical protein ZWY2020_057544 [Hordeum vulgare]